MRAFGIFLGGICLVVSSIFFILTFAPQWLDVQTVVPVAVALFQTMIAVALLILGLRIIWTSVSDLPK